MAMLRLCVGLSIHTVVVPFLQFEGRARHLEHVSVGERRRVDIVVLRADYVKIRVTQERRSKLYGVLQARRATVDPSSTRGDKHTPFSSGQE